MKRSLQRNSILTALIFSLWLFAGCSKKEETPPAPVKPTKPPVQKKMTSASAAVMPIRSSAAKPVASGIDFTKKRDPFKPDIIAVTPASKNAPRPGINRANLIPVQRYDVEQFKVTGIIVGLKENRAMIIDPDGKGYVAKKGMLIGPNGGKIIRITASTVEVEEGFKDDFGRLKKRIVKLSLQRKR